MCGIFAVFLKDETSSDESFIPCAHSPTKLPPENHSIPTHRNCPNAYPYILNGLTVLQHRGQDSAGIHTNRCKHKGVGKVDKVFDMGISDENGNYGVGHVRYCTAGNLAALEAQPLDIGDVSLVHNGNLTNVDDLIPILHQYNLQLSTTSDSEIILQLFAKFIGFTEGLSIDAVYEAVKSVMNLCQGSYSVAIMIRGYGIVAFRDPRGIRPLCFGQLKGRQLKGRQLKGGQLKGGQLKGCDESEDIVFTDFGFSDETSSIRESDNSGAKNERRNCPESDGYAFASDGYAFASESVALKSVGFDLVGDVAPGECIIVSNTGLYRKTIIDAPNPTPCLFEYIYFARPESTIDGILVYQARKNMGEALAYKIMREHPTLLTAIDVVMPVPDSARISALRASYILQKPYCEGLIKNAYVGRTFIMPSQQERKKSLKMKLNTIDQEFENRTVLIIDDSIVRGNTSKQIVEIVRKAGAKQIIFASIAPPVRFPNIYGIAIPTETELVASGNKMDAEIAQLIGADMVIYNDLQDILNRIDLKEREFEVSCFSKRSPFS